MTLLHTCQIELRVLAKMSGDERLLQHFKDKIDVHKLTAERIFNASKPSKVVSCWDVRAVCGAIQHFSAQKSCL